ncbi:MAG: hypothetical protein LJE68_04725 [Rhodobacter sp.]|nr:hypothetical protein [Rhodobacter sp.]
MKHVLMICVVLALAGCAGQMPGFLKGPRGLRGPAPSQPAAVAPVPAPESDVLPLDGPVLTPPDDARTAEEFDTTSAADRAAAVTAPPDASEGGRLGTTIASLGDPAEAGFWIKTPLVSQPAQGRIVYVTSGRSVQVQLIPSGGAPGSGSQVSLAAMRLLDAPLTELPELVVYKN